MRTVEIGEATVALIRKLVSQDRTGIKAKKGTVIDGFEKVYEPWNSNPRESRLFSVA